MVKAAWNLLALLMVPVAGFWGYATLRTGAFPLLAVTFAFLAALSWGFPSRRHARWRTVVGWTYTGLSVGVIGGVGAGLQPFWLAALAVTVGSLVLLTLPEWFGTQYWTARMLLERPAGWSGPETPGRDDVLLASPFTLHRVVKVTEQVEGAVVQHSDRSFDRFEARYGDDAARSSQTLGDLEEWVLTLYRRARRLRGLPLLPELAPRQERSHEENLPVHLYPDAWLTASELSFADAVLSAPFTVLVRFLHDSEYRVVYGNEGDRLSRAFETEFSGGDPREFYPVTLSQMETRRRGLIAEKVTLQWTRSGRVLGTFPDLAGAEAEVWRRYGASRRVRFAAGQ